MEILYYTLHALVIAYVMFGIYRHTRDYWRSGALQSRYNRLQAKISYWILPKWKKSLVNNNLFRTVNYSINNEEPGNDLSGVCLDNYTTKRRILRGHNVDIKLNYESAPSLIDGLKSYLMKKLYVEDTPLQPCTNDFKLVANADTQPDKELPINYKAAIHRYATTYVNTPSEDEAITKNNN